MQKTNLYIVAVTLILAAVTFTNCTASRVDNVTSPYVIPVRAGTDDQSKFSNMILSQQNVGLWVNGEGKAAGAPDTAIVQLGVESQQKTVAMAQREAASSMEKVMQVIKSKGVAEKDIQTQQYSITPVKRWIDKENREELLGYRVSNTVVVKVRKIDSAGSVIDAVGEAGGDTTRMTSIRFAIDDPSQLYKEARAKAVADAMEKARQIASAAGVKLGKQTYISESTGYVPSPVNYMRAEAAAPAPAPMTPISAGELEYRINVQVVFSLD